MDLLKVWKYSGAFGDFRPEKSRFLPSFDNKSDGGKS